MFLSTTFKLHIYDYHSEAEDVLVVYMLEHEIIIEVSFSKFTGSQKTFLLYQGMLQKTLRKSA